MKEATGELNMTILVIISIGILSAFFFTVLWPSMNNNLNMKTKCRQAICGNVKNGDVVDGMVNCTYKGQPLVCPYKG